MTTIVVPDALYEAAVSAAASFGSTPERKTLKALRDVVKRAYRVRGLGYVTCPQCRGLAVETDSSDLADLRCLECSAPIPEED